MTDSLLGARVRDVVTGVEGIATVRAEHLTGCTRYWVELSHVDRRGDQDGVYVDEARLQVLEPDAAAIRRDLVADAPAPGDPGAPGRRPGDGAGIMLTSERRPPR